MRNHPEERPEKLRRLDRCVDQIIGAQIETAFQELRRLPKMFDEAVDTFKVYHILSALYFRYINDRIRTIYDLSHGTFEWIFGDYPPRPGSYYFETPFPAWLAHVSGVFHIVGRAGSGKLTLMKFLCQHDRIMDLLRRWAGDKTLLVSSFFF